MNDSDTLQFSNFAIELTKFYENDDLAPGLHISWVDNTPDNEAVGLWYVAIHRYPFTGERRMERVVVCSQFKISFGVALFELYKEWKQIRNLNHEEEAHARIMLDTDVHSRRRRPPRRSQR